MEILANMIRSSSPAFATLLTLFLGVAAPSQAEKSPFANVSMRVFADLLKISLDPPAVSAVVQGATMEEGLVIEDVSWPSIDNDRVSAYVVRPTNASGRLPVIICLHGSSTNREVDVAPKYGYGEWTRYGTDRKGKTLFGWARELSRRGYITLAMTQRGLDRREPNTESRNKDLLVHGRNVMGTIIYEIRQAITYLQQRPDVDPARIGMTGISFGGITTFYTWLVDDRIAAAAPICGGVGSVQEFIEHGERTYHGIYWWIPDMLTKGDHGDFAAAMAPRPLMLWAPASDIGMPNEGIDKFLQVVVSAYKQAGAPDHLVIHRPPGEHALTLEAVDAMSRFFDKFLRGK